VGFRSFRSLDTAGRVRRMRHLVIGNTIGGVIVAALAAAFLPIGLALVVIAFMVLGVADTWYLERRLRRTGRLTR
jgi:uncharacterized membrane protein